jgi:hypothetical protein
MRDVRCPSPSPSLCAHPHARRSLLSTASNGIWTGALVPCSHIPYHTHYAKGVRLPPASRCWLLAQAACPAAQRGHLLAGMHGMYIDTLYQPVQYSPYLYPVKSAMCERSHLALVPCTSAGSRGIPRVESLPDAVKMHLRRLAGIAATRSTSCICICPDNALISASATTKFVPLYVPFSAAQTAHGPPPCSSLQLAQ